MNKKIVIVCAVMGLMATTTMLAEDMDSDKKMNMNMEHRMMMPPTTMVAVEGGGVVVLVGNKLFKFDANMRLRSEGKLPIDKEHMKEMMMDKKKMHEMMNEMYPSKNSMEMN